MSESWDNYAEGWDDDDGVKLYAEKAFQSLEGIIKLDGLTVLDFGCGTGLLTEKLAFYAQKIVALDTSEKMLSVLESKNLKNVDTLDIELSEEATKSSMLLHTKFDLIVASSVCAFLPDYEKTLGVIKSLLVPTGIFVQWDWMKSEEDPDFGFTTKMIEAAFKRAGLRVCSVSESFAIESTKGSMKVVMGVAENV